MTPGLAGGPPFPEKAKKGAIVAVASAQSPTVPLVVGVCEIDVSALVRVQGAKGHAVQNVHWSGDELWAWSAAGNPGVAPPAELEGWLEGDDDIEELQAQAEALDLDHEDDTDGGVPLNLKDIADGENVVEGEDSTYGELSTKGIEAFYFRMHIWLMRYCRNRRRFSKRFSIWGPSSQNRASKAT